MTRRTVLWKSISEPWRSQSRPPHDKANFAPKWDGVSFQYYLYISDSKVDMLLAQIDPALTRKSTSEFSLNLKIFGAKRGVESPGADRIARLERVVRHLEDYDDGLGSVDEPGRFFWGTLPMRWGPFNQTSLIYFGGSTKHTIVGLGGSSKHMFDPPTQPADQALARSVMPSLLDGLATEPEIGDLFDRDFGDDDVLRAVRIANDGLRGPAQNVEFVAKRLLYGPSPAPELDEYKGTSVLLGSPLYVALVD